MIIRMTASSGGGAGGQLASYEEGELERPNWTGQTPLSRLVGALISFKPLYSVLKLGARQVLIRFKPNSASTSLISYRSISICGSEVHFSLILHVIESIAISKFTSWWHYTFYSTAEKTNVPWREMTKEILESDVYKEMESIENPSIVYPDCKFLSPFF